MKPFWVETNVENNDYQIYHYDDLVQYVNTQPTVIVNFKLKMVRWRQIIRA